MPGKGNSLMNSCGKFIVPVFLSVLLSSTLPALAATVVVGSCMPNKVSYDSITDAVEGVPAGSIIEVCPGVHAEQVVISKSLTLKGITVGNSAYPVITPPSGGLAVNALGLNVPSFWGVGWGFAAQILIQGGANVTVSDLALDAMGTNTQCDPPTFVGILLQDASATVSGVSVKNQLQVNTCGGSIVNFLGVGVLSQNDTGGTTTVAVKDSTFVNAAQAIEADGANVASTITGNSILGNPTSNFNAISILEGNATIENNDISNFNYPPAGSSIFNASYGIFLVCGSGGTAAWTAAGNVIANTQVGIYDTCPTLGVSLTNNTISYAPLIGINAAATNGLIQGNHIRNTMTAIRFPAGASNLVQNNVINDACAAYGFDPAAGSTSLLGNTIFNAVNVSLVNTTSLCP